MKVSWGVAEALTLRAGEPVGIYLSAGYRGLRLREAIQLIPGNVISGRAAIRSRAIATTRVTGD